MQMEGMLASIQVVKHNFNHIACIQDERIGVDTIRNWICGIFAKSEYRVESWNLWWNEGIVVNESTKMSDLLQHINKSLTS